MRNPRRYGPPPFTVAVVHGGPGAPGGMAPVARELSSTMGVVEPLQTSDSLEGQVEELKAILGEEGSPFTLVGWSWGAWLSILVASGHPHLVRKLILVGSGPFQEEYATSIMPTRMRRLEGDEQDEVTMLLDKLESRASKDRDALMTRLGTIISRADSYESVRSEEEPLGSQYEIHRRVWERASEMRRSGELLEAVKGIECPVVAVHGDFDPHPYEGVMDPLSELLPDFRFILLRRCGHTPWIERHARDEFFRVLRSEIG